MPPFRDLTGQKFGRWTVMYNAGHHIEPDDKTNYVPLQM